MSSGEHLHRGRGAVHPLGAGALPLPTSAEFFHVAAIDARATVPTAHGLHRGGGAQEPPANGLRPSNRSSARGPRLGGFKMNGFLSDIWILGLRQSLHPCCYC